MYLKNTIRNNPLLLEAMVELHQRGHIPPNSWVIDLDTIADNADILAETARKLNLQTYLMSKQHNRNPYINKLALSRGLNKMVAVDIQGVLSARRYGLPLGHAGHLNQIPKSFVPAVVEMRPDVITVYNKEHAEWIDLAAGDRGVVQNLLIKVFSTNEACFDGQESGLYIEELAAFLDSIASLRNIRLVGVTAFPCLSYNETAEDRVELTENMNAVTEAAELLSRRGIEIQQINTPGNTSSRVMPLLKERGATHVEPGNALLGTTPDNAFDPGCAEKTAFGYITEISHFHDGSAFAYGGGVYHTNYSDEIYGLVGSSWDEAAENRILYDHSIVQDIDYHMQLRPHKEQRCRVGDSAVFVYRTQMHMTRSWIVPVSGLSGKRELKLHYIFDNANNALDNNFNPVSPEAVCEDIDRMIREYS